MKLRTPKLPRPGALMIVVLCFFSSGVLRMWETGAAIAEEVQQASMQAKPDESATDMSAENCPAPLEPANMLAAFREREQQLNELEQRLLNREQILRVARIKVEDHLEKLEDAERRLSATMSQADGAAEKDLERLTSVYENMKPKEAATIFETMDIEFAAGFLMRMRPDAAAGILSNLESNIAYAISVVMAGRNVGVPTE